jgi:hypothetical protein
MIQSKSPVYTAAAAAAIAGFSNLSETYRNAAEHYQEQNKEFFFH